MDFYIQVAQSLLVLVEFLEFGAVFLWQFLGQVGFVRRLGCLGRARFGLFFFQVLAELGDLSLEVVHFLGIALT